MSQSVIGESPVEEDTGSLYAFAQRYDRADQVSVGLSTARFIFPGSSMVGLSKLWVQDAKAPNRTEEGDTPLQLDDGECVQAHMVCYRDNPYRYGEGAMQEVSALESRIPVLCAKVKASRI